MLNLSKNKYLLKESKFSFLSKLFWAGFCFFCLYACCKTSIFSLNLTPFGFALLFSLIWAGFSPYLMGGMFLVAYSLAEFTLEHLYIGIYVFILVVVIHIFHKWIKTKISISLAVIYTLLSQALFIYFNIGNIRENITLSLAVVVGLLFLYCCIYFLQGTVKRGFNLKLNTDEIICGSIVLIVASIGLSDINLYGIELIKVLASFCILLSTYIFGSNETIFLGALFGLGYAISSTNPIYIASFTCYALLSLAFKTNFKLFSCIAIVVVEVFFGLYFEKYTFFEVTSIISVAFSGFVFMLLPIKSLNYIKDILGGFKDKVAIRNVVNRSKSAICKRLGEITGIFDEMNVVFRDMTKGVLPEDEAKEILKQDLVKRVCSSCPDRNKCLRVNGEFTTEVFDDLISAGFEKGKISLLDISQYLSSRCNRLNFLINTANSLFSSYKQYNNMVANMDASRILIADQLYGVSSVIKELSKEVNLNIVFDMPSENRIVEELAYRNINCIEAVVYEQNTTEKNVSLLVKNESIKEKEIEKCVTKICKCPMGIVGTMDTEIPNTSMVNLKTKPNFDIVFGSASCKKNGTIVSGDTHSLIKISNGKFMVALCDGMGSGTKAQKTSELAISLIENFYKAGFDNNIILSSVNRLLSLNNDENFSALDICVLDLRKNICDFIKLGTPSGYIKHENWIEEIESSGLPIGVLEEMRPHISKKTLQNFDTIILLSDGISEAFKSDDLKNYINNLSSINPQTISEDILDRARDLNNGVCEDDMTVVVVRVFPVA